MINVYIVCYINVNGIVNVVNCIEWRKGGGDGGTLKYLTACQTHNNFISAYVFCERVTTK